LRIFATRSVPVEPDGGAAASIASMVCASIDSSNCRDSSTLRSCRSASCESNTLDGTESKTTAKVRAVGVASPTTGDSVALGVVASGARSTPVSSDWSKVTVKSVAARSPLSPNGATLNTGYR